MGQPAAKQGDRIIATDIHIVMVPTSSGEVPTPLPHPFSGVLEGQLSRDVYVMGRPAAVVGSTATNTPPHVPQGGRFQREPSNKGEVTLGSLSVFINGKAAARHGDTAKTCNDPVDITGGQVVVPASTVLIG